MIGSGLGQWKQEYSNQGGITEGYFVAPKSYALKLQNGTEVVKWKGIKVGGIDFKKIYNNPLEHSLTINQEKVQVCGYCWGTHCYNKGEY